MGPGKWKGGGVMVKSAFCTAGRVAGITGRTVVLISVYPLVFVVHGRLEVIMAVDTGKLSVVACIRVAIGTECPLTIVFS